MLARIVLGSISLAAVLLACGADGADGSASPVGARAPGPDDDRDAEVSPDAGRPGDAGGDRARDASKDGNAKNDASGDGSTGSDAAGPTGFIELSCDSEPPTRSPDGAVVAYNDCQSNVVVRNVVTGAVTRHPRLAWDRVAAPFGLVFRNGSGAGGTSVVGWDGTLLGTLPMDNPKAVARVRGSSARFVMAHRGEVIPPGGSGSRQEYFIFADSSAAGPFESARVDVADLPDRSDVIVSGDGGLAAALDTGAGQAARLVVTATTSQSTPKTYVLPTVSYARWIPETVFGSTALFFASRQLYHADLTTGAVKQLSSAPVVAESTAGLQIPGPELVHVACNGADCFWIEATNGSTHAIKKWSRSSPSAAPATLVSGAGAAHDIVRYPVDRRFALTPDGAWIVYQLEESPVTTKWYALPIAGGARKALHVGAWQPSMGGQTRLGAGNPPSFFDVASGETVAASFVFGDSLSGHVGPDGALWVLRTSSTAAGTSPTLSVERLTFDGQTSSALARPAAAAHAQIIPRDFVPTTGSFVLRVLDPFPATGPVPRYAITIGQ